jgi:peroxiredoxin
MRIQAFSRVGVALVGFSLAAWGCNQSTSIPDQSSVQSDPSRPKPLKYEVKVDPPRDTPTLAPASDETDGGGHGSETADVASVAKAPLPLDDPQAAELTMPQVVLSQAHAQTCLVGVGGSLPDLQLVDLEDVSQSISNLMGSKLTVVLFWNGAQPSAVQELIDLGPDVADRFSGHGVAVVGINVGDDPQLVREFAKTAKARFRMLGDPHGAAFGQVATRKIPRTYLVDATGKIAWLDIEYSRTTRRELNQAIRYLLSHDSAGTQQSP